MSFKNIANSLNTYVESKEYKYIEEIEDHFKSLFSVEYVKFWKYDSRDEILVMLEDKKHKIKSLTTSVTKQAIDSKSTILSNHIMSDKSFSLEIDNPLEIKMKALMVFPIVKNDKVLGVLKLWKGMKQRKVFSKQDEKKLETFVPLLIKIIETKSIEKDELLALMGEEPSKTVTKTKEIKSPISVKEKPKKVNTNKVELELEALKKELSLYMEKEKNYEQQFIEFQNELKNTEEKYKELEVSALEFSSEINDYQQNNKKLSSELEMLISENKDLHAELKKNNTKSIKELKSEKALLLQNNSINIEENIEYIFNKVAPVFSKNEYSLIMFELMVYAFYSKSNMNDIEDFIRKTKIVPELIEEYYYKGGIKINNEKCMITDLTNNIKEYGKNIFLEKNAIHINISEDVPPSLVFDAPKIQSIIYHLLLDLYQFIDYSKDLNIKLVYKNKTLMIELLGAIHQNNSLFKSMFKQSKLGGNEKDRVGLILSNKLIKRLKGKIESSYDNEHYKFVLSVPTQKIKM